MTGGLHKTKQCPIVVRESTHAKLKRICKERGLTMDQVIAEMLDAAEREEQSYS